jgi:hypothetical protein
MTRQQLAPAAAGRAMRRALLPAAGALLVLATGAAPALADDPAAYSAWSAPAAVTEVNTAAHDGCPIESPNGLKLYIASTRAGGFGKNDIWVASRPDKQSPWGPMTNLGSAINTGDQEFCPTPLPGRKLLFVSDRAACGATPGMTPPVGDIYITKQRPNGTWRSPRHLGCVADGTGPNFSGGEFGPSLRTIQGVTWLYFSSTGINGNHDIYRSRQRLDGTFATPEAVTELNTAAVDQMPNISRDGTEIVFASNRGGNMDIWTATLDLATGRWSSPVPVAAVNTAEPETRPSFSGDGVRLYFGRGATADVYMSTRVKLHDD